MNEAKMQSQKNEFDAFVKLAKAYDAMPAVVDDDYPLMRNRYEVSLREFIIALANNGRKFAIPVSDLNAETFDVCSNLNDMRDLIHRLNINWWRNIHTGEPIDRNKGELLMLIVSECAEAMEGERKNLPDTHLPHRRMAEVELADALIRILDYCGGMGYDIRGAVAEKVAYNARRADHKVENRRGEHGKKW